MEIFLENTGKRYNREWIFRHATLQFKQGKAYAITGPNGSGKSTLLQVIAGSTLHSEGNIHYRKQNGESMDALHAYKHLSMAAPYLELIEEMTATEFLEFHKSFKPLLAPIKEILSTVTLGGAANKQIRYYSSGMKQRLKLAQAFFSDVQAIMLDEPTTNLDAAGVALYKQLVHNYKANRLVIVSSNDPNEYDFCDEVVSIEQYKQPQ